MQREREGHLASLASSNKHPNTLFPPVTMTEQNSAEQYDLQYELISRSICYYIGSPGSVTTNDRDSPPASHCHAHTHTHTQGLV